MPASQREELIAARKQRAARSKNRPLWVRAAMPIALLFFAGCYLRGPEPTVELVESPVGPFEIDTVIVPPSVEGFGGATIYYPANVEPKFGGLAIVPGFGNLQSHIDWYGPRIASHGFVVILIDTDTPWDIPDQRGEQLIAALDYLTTDSSVKDVVDARRLAVMGYSFGGGGVIHATRLRPNLKAAIPLAMWFWDNDQSESTVPTLLVSCENDDGDNAAHTGVVYATLPESTPKALLEIAGGDHQCVANVGPTDHEKTTIARMIISFLKRHVDGDGRYEEFICPEPGNPDVSMFACDEAVP